LSARVEGEMPPKPTRVLLGKLEEAEAAARRLSRENAALKEAKTIAEKSAADAWAFARTVLHVPVMRATT
jgi:hypothetical protein